MNIALLRDFLLACTVINYAILCTWFVVFCTMHDALFQLHFRWFRLSEENFDALHYQGMSIYKIGIMLLNLIPFLALCWLQSVSKI